MKKTIIKYRQIIIIILALFPIVSSRAQSSKFEDSLRNDMVLYLHMAASYDQAIAVLSQKKKLDSTGLLTYYTLLKKKEKLRQVTDSLALALAEKYNIGDLPDDALPDFLKLRFSNDSLIRNRAVVASDSLVNQKKKAWHEKYPWTSFPLKPILPWILLYFIFLLILWIVNKQRNKGRLLIICRDNAESGAFMSSIKYMLNEFLSNWSQEQQDAVVPPGHLRLLPYLDADIPDGIKNLVSATVPSKLTPALDFLWRTGVKPLYTLHILVERYDNDISVYVQLLKAEIIIGEWDKTVPQASLPGTRLDIAYEALMQIKSTG